MPSGFYSQDNVSRAKPAVKTDSPLDSTDPKLEPEEPRSDYHKPWGYYAFLYESERTLLAGGLSSLYPTIVGGITISGPDVWAVPNLEMLGGAPGEATEAPSTSLLSMCTAAAMAENEVMQTICTNLAAVNDPCFFLNNILPNLTGFIGSDGTTRKFAESTMTLVNGNIFILDTVKVLVGCQQHPAFPIHAIRARVITPGGSVVTQCQKCWRDEISGCNCADGLNTFAEARDAVIACLTDAHSARYTGLGCV